MNILQFPHPMLLKPCEEVIELNREILYTLDDMWEIMLENNGVGLTCNQIGLDFNAFVMKGPEGRLNCINPYISARSQAPANLKEGCLSSPGEYLVVPGRSEWVQLQYQDLSGQNKSVVLKGIHSVCAQHEIQHTFGESFMEHKSLPSSTRKILKKKWGLQR